jgi:hypothetical protein
VNVTASAGLGYTTADGIHAARTNLSKVESDLMSKLGTNAQPTMAALKYLLVPTALYGQAKALMGPLAPGQQNNFVNELEVLRSPYLALSSITGNSATSYYGFADPNRATGVMLSTVAGIDTPRVEQYDPGAVAALRRGRTRHALRPAGDRASAPGCPPAGGCPGAGRAGARPSPGATAARRRVPAAE